MYAYFQKGHYFDIPKKYRSLNKILKPANSNSDLQILRDNMFLKC